MIEIDPDICLLDYKTYLGHKDTLRTWQESKSGLKFVFVTNDIKDILEIVQTHPEEYLLLAPIEEESLLKVFENVKTKLKRSAVVIKLAHAEDKRIYVKDLNYINIIKRNLRYHLADGREIDGPTLRNSFVKEIGSLLNKPELYFIQPSLLINLTNVEALWPDHLQFDNGDILYYPKTAYDKLKLMWKEYLV